MDRDFTWNTQGADESSEIESIKARIEELKEERAGLVAQLEGEYSDNALAAQMMRAGDEGAMYKFFREQKNQLNMHELENKEKGLPTQDEFDKVLETLQATRAAMEDKTLDPAVKAKYELLAENYEAQLNEKLAKNPQLSRRNYVSGDGQGGDGKGGSLYEFSNEVYSGKLSNEELERKADQLKGERGVKASEVDKLVEEGKKRNFENDKTRIQIDFALNNAYTDEEIDEMVNKAIKANPGYTDEFKKLADDAKKRSDTRYAEYKNAVDKANLDAKKIYDMWDKADDSTKRSIEEYLGRHIDSKTGKFVRTKIKSKNDWLKGKK